MATAAAAAEAVLADSFVVGKCAANVKIFPNIMANCAINLS